MTAQPAGALAPGDVEVRPWTPGDAESMGRAIAESLEHLRPWMPWVEHEPMSPTERRALIEGWAAQEAAGGDRVRGIFVRGAVAGGCGLHRRVGPGAWEIGYWVHAAWARRGVASAAVALLAEEAWADPATRHLEIHHDEANAASGGVPAKLGFRVVERRPKAPTAPGERGTEVVWRLDRPAGGGLMGAGS